MFEGRQQGGDGVFLPFLEADLGSGGQSVYLPQAARMSTTIVPSRRQTVARHSEETVSAPTWPGSAEILDV